MPTTQIHLTDESDNVKTGPMPVSTTTRATCPDACPFKGNGCYAEAFPMRNHWDAVTRGERGTDLEGFALKIEALESGTIWRHNQGGDLPGDGTHIDGDQLERIVSANHGKRGFTYTHYPMVGDNVDYVRAANECGFTINLSANSVPHADELADLEAGPVCTVLPADLERRKQGRGNKAPWAEPLEDYRKRVEGLETPQGRKVVVCPATYRDDVSCKSCQLCQRQRATIVGFPAHGNAKRKASAAVADSEAAYTMPMAAE